MGEISDAMDRAREAAQPAAEDAPVRRNPHPAPTPRTRGEGAGSRNPAGENEPTPPESSSDAPALPERDFSLDSVRESLSARKEEYAPSGATRDAFSEPASVHAIPRERDLCWPSRAVVADPQGTSVVRFPHLAVRVRAVLDRLPRPSLLVTSALKGEGKTTVSVNLALALASIAPDQRIALVDLDLRGSSVSAVLGIDSKFGIENVLAGEVGLEDVRVRTDQSGLDVYPVAHPTSNAHALLGGRAEQLLAELVERYDYVIADGPPVLPVPDTPLLAPIVGGCLVVVRSRQTRRSAFRELMDLMPRSTIVGAFVNDVPERKDRDAYGYYGSAAPKPEDVPEEDPKS